MLTSTRNSAWYQHHDLHTNWIDATIHSYIRIFLISFRSFILYLILSSFILCSKLSPFLNGIQKNEIEVEVMRLTWFLEEFTHLVNSGTNCTGNFACQWKSETISLSAALFVCDNVVVQSESNRRMPITRLGFAISPLMRKSNGNTFPVVTWVLLMAGETCRSTALKQKLRFDGNQP